MNIDTRLKAFYAHLLISVLVIVFLLAIIFFIWYPYELIFAGGVDGLKILMGVDLVLGPLLTLIIFVPGKKGLKSDLSLIALLQTSCLLLGMWLIYSQRPLLQVVIDDGVHLLSASDLSKYDIEVSLIPGRYPKNVMTDLPEDESSWDTIKFSTEFADLKPFSMRSDLYLAMSDVTSEKFNERVSLIRERTKTVELEKLNNNESTACIWMPVISVHVSGFACYLKEKGIIKLSDKSL